MSERGSFVTEYIYCKKCFDVVKSVLLGNEKYLCSTTIPHWNKEHGKELPIIAGKLGGLYRGEELDTFEFEFIPQLQKRLCHSMRLAVLAEAKEKIFIVSPDN